MIEVSGFSKRYDGTQAVRDLSFTVARGEIIGLVGLNGAGKTTTLRSICGILAPTAGRIAVGGFDITKQPVEAKRRLAYVPDTPHPFELLTVAEHLKFVGLAYGVAYAGERVDALLRKLELHEKRDAFASTLSRGQQQKLAIACAFLRAPDALLLDEPLTGLDPAGMRVMRDAVAAEAARGAAVIVSSHQLELVERMCSRVLVLHRGRLRALGTLEEIRAVADKGADATLEDVFFALTEGAPESPTGVDAERATG
ncbi:MAG: ABC transporter ATP-binding protein [Planctomycetes bacterium]|nr:ABC transporter ATP-binding protein [Planctomycetota bacterium]